MIEQIYFAIFAFVAVGCALGVLVSRHPIHGAMSLIGLMVALSGVYSLMASPFLATLQILVYAGAIMMLVIFVIMVLNSAKDASTPRFDLPALVGIFPALAIGAVITRIVLAWDAKDGQQVAESMAKVPAERGTVDAISKVLFGGQQTSGWAILFLAVGLLLLTAIVGAVLLAKRRLDKAPADPTPAHGGHG
ncbi:MAG: NADH-quinone oxidoreductase subunit J [Fibrobacterota bacterium]|nr:NADH-quinone oxidoreductase subunit J [Fibrobacterota bacterium]QQS05165.1 MAG: NADH-quinone oxidoreductase subunit J [Fibrobacterota bacterium]